MRQGSPITLPFAQESFRDVISMRARRTGHAGELEAHALLLAVRHLCRSAANHGKHAVFAVDAQAVVYAALKGRSSAPGFAFTLRRIGALLLATGIRAHYMWIPSEHNPADWPSRLYEPGFLTAGRGGHS